MSECEYANRIGAYHDGELDAMGRVAMERHLAQCADCAAELGRIRRLSDLMSHMPQAEVSNRAIRRFHAAADLAPLGVIRRMATELTAAAAAILVICGIWLWRLPAASEPAGPLPIWEVSVLGRSAETPASTSDDQLALWIVQDLARESGHDKK